MSNTNLYKALLEAQREMPPVRESSRNPHFNSRYADLETVLGTVMPILHKHGLLLTQGADIFDGQRVLTTRLIHAETGESLFSNTPLVAKDMDNPQALGGSITYARRYGVLAMLGVATEDDDGNTASAPPFRPTPVVNDYPQSSGRVTSAPQAAADQTRAVSGTGPTPAQLKYIERLADEKGILDSIDYYANEWYGSNVESLERRDASAMIDRLKDFVPYAQGETEPLF